MSGLAVTRFASANQPPLISAYRERIPERIHRVHNVGWGSTVLCPSNSPFGLKAFIYPGGAFATLSTEGEDR